MNIVVRILAHFGLYAIGAFLAGYGAMAGFSSYAFGVLFGMRIQIFVWNN